MGDSQKKKNKKNVKINFEESIQEIDFEINKRRKKWSLTTITWMDFEDVAQILRIHIYTKWHLYDPAKPLAPWLNRIISNQIKNLIRNNYSNFTRPCLKCSASEGNDYCSIYGKQDNSCPLYAFWEKSKKKAHDVKIPLPLDNHSQEVYKEYSDTIDLESNLKRLNKALEEHLKPTEWKLYQLIYLENLSEEQAARRMGYKSSEEGRSPGYKQIKNIRKSIIEKTKKLIEGGKLDIYLVMSEEEFCREDICLSKDRQESIIEEWNSRKENPPSLKELVILGFPDIPEELQDGRSKYGKCVKAFLTSVNISAKKAHENQGKNIELTEEQKEFINNNVGTMRGHEMARVLFEDHTLNNLSSEARAVNDYINTLPSQVSVFEPEGNDEIGDFKPPKTFDKTLARINKYVLDGIDKSNIPASVKKGINSLIGYMHTYRFLHIINGYSTITDRDLFESSFIRYTYDKADLTQEEVDQYIVLSIEVVISSTIQRRVEHLQGLLDQNADQTDGARISMALVESINTAQNEYNQCVNRQQKLLNDLKEKRSDRLKNQIKENASILNLVQLWKEEETRKKLIDLAEMKKKTISEEVDKFQDMDDVKCRILGISKDEAING